MTDSFNATGTLEDGVFKPYGEEAKSEAAAFADLAPAAQKSLADAGITTVEQAKALGHDGLVALPDIGKAAAEKILAL